MTNALFPAVRGLLHGGDYNPEQWLDRPDILEEDVRLMKMAGVNCVTLGVFSWSAYEPRENEFRFEWLREIMDRLYANGIYTILATPTGARPAWLDAQYPECMRVSRAGVRNHHGVRHNHCLTSPAFRRRAEIVIRRLGEAVGNHPGVILWHISNELGGECCCDLCQNRFRDYLRARYHNNIDELNHAWWTAFWSHTYTSFEQIELPYQNGEGSIMGLNLAWKEFTTWNMADYIRFEREILRDIAPDTPATTNFMRLYQGLDYHALARELDVISWDSYPMYHTDAEPLSQTAAATAFDHAVMRGMRPERPFMLMESTPSLVNWHPFNKLKRPGAHMLASLQAVACGSDTVQYFQWRKGRGSYEQYHGAVMDHLGRDDTRVFREVAQVGEALKKLAPVAGSVVHAQAAVLFDWSNRWAIDNMAGLDQSRKLYEETCRTQHEILASLGVETDVVSPMADLSGYKLVAAPMLYLLHDGEAAHLIDYVRGGGTLVLTYLTGYLDKDTLNYLGGFPGDGLKDVVGLYSEEIDTLYPTERNGAAFADGFTAEIRDFCEILKVQDAEVLATYTGDFYQGTPVVTRRREGLGQVYYVGARLSNEGMAHIYRQCMEGMEVHPMPEHTEHHRRESDDRRFDFYLNHSTEPVTVPLRQNGRELLTGLDAETTLTLPPYGAAVVASDK